MEHSKLSSHKFVKGKFITPLNEVASEFTKEDSWSYGRLPEYIWIGLIFERYDRKTGLTKLYQIITFLRSIAPDLPLPNLSNILSLPYNIQAAFFEKVIELTSPDILSSLTIILTYSNYPVFSEFFTRSKMSLNDRLNLLLSAMKKTMDHQSDESTDIRFIVLSCCVLSGKLIIQDSQKYEMKKYPQLEHSDEKMRKIRPLIRAMEGTLLTMFKDEGLSSQIFKIDNKKYIENFWEEVSRMTDCELFGIKYPEENKDLTLYMEYLYEVYAYLSQSFVTLNPLDDKMNVIMGIATYSYKRFKEIVEHKLFNAISGRGGVRVLIENFIMLKYLLNNESSHRNIWKEYQSYGIGLYKLILTKWRESNKSDEKSHFDIKYIDALVNEKIMEEFINMDTSYFNKQGIREKAISVQEKELYGLYYDYDSSFEHGLWGAIRESSLVKCANPAHNYHCVPDIDGNITLKSVLYDCIFVMNKTISLLNDVYGIPENLLKGIMEIEQSFDK